MERLLCRCVERLQEGGILEARRYVVSDENVVECFIDGIDKQMESNAEEFKKSLANKVRYAVRTALRTRRIPYQIRCLWCQPQSTEDVLSKLQRNNSRLGFESWCTAHPRDRPAVPCSNPPVRSEAVRMSAEDDGPTERCTKFPAMSTAAVASRRKKLA